MRVEAVFVALYIWVLLGGLLIGIVVENGLLFEQSLPVIVMFLLYTTSYVAAIVVTCYLFFWRINK